MNRFNTLFPSHFFLQFLPFLRVFSQILAVHLPAPGIPSLGISTRNGLTDLGTTVLLRIPTLKTSLSASRFEDLQFSAAQCLALGSCTAKESMEGFKKRLLENKSGTVWWGCEFAKGQAGMGERECSRLGGGEEMKACSRCLSVRYCSRDHQKADWKYHKPSCFQPSW